MSEVLKGTLVFLINELALINEQAIINEQLQCMVESAQIRVHQAESAMHPSWWILGRISEGS